MPEIITIPQWLKDQAEELRRARLNQRVLTFEEAWRQCRSVEKAYLGMPQKSANR